MIRIDETETRNSIVKKMKTTDPARYMRKANYDLSRFTEFRGINLEDLLKKDLLTLSFKVGDYMVTISFNGFMKELLDEVARQKTNYVNIDTVERALMRAIDNSDIKVNSSFGGILPI